MEQAVTLTPLATELNVAISARAAAQVARGQLWIFSNEIYSKPASARPGTWCQFLFREKIIATGYFNPHSLIAGRVVALGAVDDIAALIRGRLTAAFESRRAALKSGSTRLVFSEGDLLPGLIIDWYGGESDVLVIQSSTAGVDAALDTIVAELSGVFRKVFERAPTGIVIRADGSIRRLEGVQDFSKVVAGSESALRSGSVHENGVSYGADFLSGQKTGFFLDQRDNRAFLASEMKAAPGSTVLDLFCYSGGWGLAALAAGASRVTFVDQSEEALALVRQGLHANKLSTGAARLVAEDVFDFLEKESPTGAYDVIVVDPPAFVKSKKNIPQAKKAYEKLNRLAWRALKPGGLLLTCSCSYHLSPSDFMELLQAAVAKEGGWARVAYQGGQASDHPILLAMPETRYLKCVGLRKISAE
jgi:23S rRNA (cytosine1962-C5)-methyltransferase